MSINDNYENKKSGCGNQGAKKMSLEEILDDYIKKQCGQDEQRTLRYFQDLTFEECVGKASMCIDDSGKRNIHLNKLLSENIEAGSKILLSSLPDIKSCNCFDELFSLIENLIAHIKGLGEMYIYDTALRIGANLGLYPNKVYLHCGARDGAINLLGAECSKKKVLCVNSLPKKLLLLNPYEIENILCIYKDNFLK